MALTRELVLTIGGTPAPKGSMKCIGGRGKRHQLIEDNTRTRPWRETITAALRRAAEETQARHVYWRDPQGEVHYGTRGMETADKGQPVGVEVTNLFHRPMSHYIAGDRKRLRLTAPRYPVTRTVGDVDKLERTLLDALQDAGIFPDDSQVVELVGRKRWTDHLTPDVDPGARPDYLDWDYAEHTGIVVRIYPIT